MKLGFIGLGRMGTAIARRLIEAGHALSVYNRTAEKAALLGKAGAEIKGSIAEACRDRDIVISMLADDAALHDVALAAGGLRESLSPGAIHLAMGTHGVAAIRGTALAHAEARQTLVAAPVLGRPEAAAAGQLGIIVAGPVEAVERCEALFQTIGRRVFAAGSAPEGAAAIKLANSLVLGCAIAAMGEAFALVRKHGVVPQVLYDVMTEGLFAAPAYKIYGKIIADEAYDNVGFTALLGLKDVNLSLAAGDAARVPMPSVGVVRDRLLGAIAHGDGERDWASIAREQARASGLT